MKTLYYVVEKELESFGEDCEDVTGNKTIRVYEILHNKIEKFCDIDCHNEDNSQEQIRDFLIDLEDEEVELIQL